MYKLKSLQNAIFSTSVCLLLLWPIFMGCKSSYASIPVDGNFKALEICPAYISKTKKTNPDNLQTTPSQLYQVVEINKKKPDWFRVIISNNPNDLRWVAGSCGEVSYKSKDKSQCDQSPGLADSYVLALSWQPGFCETYGYEAGRPECMQLPADSYQSSHLVLHGLWPNQENCENNYGYCGVEPRKNHCAYPSLDLNQQVAEQLRLLMPSFAYGSCLERHEWYKHGSCQVLSENNYFKLALRLTQEIQITAFATFLKEHRGEYIPKKTLEKTILSSFGEDSSNKIYLGCKNGLLVDVYLQLPPLIPEQEPLIDLVKKAPKRDYRQGCPAQIGISNYQTDNNEG